MSENRYLEKISKQFKSCPYSQDSIHNWIEHYLSEGYYIKLTTFLVRRGLFNIYYKRKIRTIHGCFNSIPHLERKCDDLVKKHGRFRFKDNILVMHTSSHGDEIPFVDIGFKTLLPGRIAISLQPRKDGNASSTNKEIAYHGNIVTENYTKPTRKTRKVQRQYLDDFMNDKQKIKQFINTLLGKKGNE